MSNLVEHAKKELDILNKNNDELQNLISENVLEIVKLFSSADYSGSAAQYVANLIERLLLYLPLTPLTGADDEWVEHEDNLFQNIRYSAVFKEGINGKAYNVEGIVFSDDRGISWFTNKDSRVDVEFPYNTPTEPIKVMKESLK